MKQSDVPICPRCNRNDDVQKILAHPDAQGCITPVRDGYMLEGVVIRPDSADWYCRSCSECFGSARVHWGRFLSERTQ